ncbi:MAG TPA: hypothetical protein VHE55_09665 [Fimbriimonadaceae bacterium]|nr:hypothetical protein [Fimbriimonadaceae bacterium]
MSITNDTKSPAQVAEELVRGVASFDLMPALSQAVAVVESRGGTPGGIHDLPFQESTVYDLSVTSANQANIPVIGSVSGGVNRRVVVLERRAYAKQTVADGIEYQGYAIRLVVTVNKLDASMKISLPFLAASAEVGTIEGKWMLQVVGLSGPKMDSAAIPPSELSVETFVLAKQSLTNLIAGIEDPTTQFLPQRVYIEKTDQQKQRDLMVAIGSCYALAALEKRWKAQDALNRISGANPAVTDAVTDVYRDFAGIQNPVEVPSTAVQKAARDLLDHVNAGPR